MSTIEKHAGRLTVSPEGVQTAYVSPLANPEAFADAHGLEVEAQLEARVDGHPAGPTFVRAIMLVNDQDRYTTVAGLVSHDRDDHAATTVDMLDFTDLDHARADWDIACDEVFAAIEALVAA